MSPTDGGSSMKEVGERLRRRRRELGLTLADVARDVGVTDVYVGSVERGVRSLERWPWQRLEALRRALQWTPEEFYEATGIELPVMGAGSGSLGVTGGGSGNVQNPPTLPSGYTMIPVVGAANGGKPVEYTVPIREDVMRPGAVAFEVHGDSMDDGSAEAIRNGDLVLVDTSLTDLVPGKVYLVELPGQGLMVKRLRRVGDALWFMSDNPINGSFPAEDAVRVVGQVYGKVSFGRVS